jgi:hypothetical protein
MTEIVKFSKPQQELLTQKLQHYYSDGTPSQISVYADKLTMWNEGRLPNNWNNK